MRYTSFRVKLWAEIYFLTIIRQTLGPKLDNWKFFRNYVKLPNDIIILVTCAVLSYNTDKQSSVKWWNFKWNFKKYKTRIWIVYGGPHGFLLLDIFISFSMQVLLTKKYNCRYYFFSLSIMFVNFQTDQIKLQQVFERLSQLVKSQKIFQHNL